MEENNKSPNEQGNKNRYHGHYNKHRHHGSNNPGKEMQNQAGNVERKSNQESSNNTRAGDQIVMKSQYIRPSSNIPTIQENVNVGKQNVPSNKSNENVNDSRPNESKAKKHHRNKHGHNKNQENNNAQNNLNASSPIMQENLEKNVPINKEQIKPKETEAQNNGKKNHKKHGKNKANKNIELENKISNAIHADRTIKVEDVQENKAEPEEEIDVTHILNPVEVEGKELMEVIGVQFRNSGKMYYFDPCGNQAKVGQHVIVETARGIEYGGVLQENRKVPKSENLLPLRPVIRVATKEDDQRYEANVEQEKSAFVIAKEKIAMHKLDMKLFDVQYSFDNAKLLFYFSSDGRIDFRELVHDLASEFHTRIEMRQIGLRDEARMIGGIGPCGRTLCCSGFLVNYTQPNIKMVKEQNLSLSASKNMGFCGRLLCCMQYECQTYAEAAKNCPSVGSIVKTEDGIGKVTAVNLLTGILKVQITKADKETLKAYAKDEVVILEKKKEDNENVKEEKELTEDN